MSQSEPPKKAFDRAPKPPARRRRRSQGHLSPWFCASVGLHVAAAMAVIWLTPVSEMLMGEPKRPERPEAAMAADRLNELIEKVREVNRRDLLRRLARLDGVHAEMGRLGGRKLADLREFEDTRIRTAPAKALELMAEVLRQQDGLLDLQRKGDLEAARFAQFRVRDLYVQVLSRLSLARAGVQRSVAAAKRAADAQKKVAGAIAGAWKPVSEAQNLIVQAVRFANYVRDREREIADVSKGIERTRKQAAAHQAKVAALQKQIERAKRAGKKETSDTIKRLNQRLRRETAARDRTRGAATAQDRYRKSLLTAKREVQQKVEAIKQQRAKIIADARKELQSAIPLQQQARKALAGAMEPLRAEIGGAPVRESAPGARSRPAPAAAAELIAPPDRTGLDIPEIYNAAVETERLIAEHYREIRAAKLAMLQDITLAQARPSVDVPTSVRPRLNESLLRREIDTPEWIEPYRQEMNAALNEMDSMVMLAESLLRLAQGYVGEDDEGLELAMETIESRMSILAMEDSALPFADLSELMSYIERLREMESLPGHEEGEGEGDHEGPEGSRLAALLALLANRPDEDSPESERHGSGLPSLGGLRDRKPKSLIGGRVVSSRGEPVEWMFVDSWYILGPLPNPGRKNIHRKFAPESAVDLDATYVNADGKTLRWKFFQSTEPRVEMPDPQEYAIYYAYTELHFDRATDLWVAVGSDDRSDIWINDMKIWESSDELKGWRIDEGFRKVHFRRGYNKVLYRIENGWGRIGFSMTLHTKRAR